MTITPVDDPDVEGAETVTLTLTADAAYTLGASTSDTVTIADNDIGPGVITGELKTWHDVTITFDGPTTSESDTPNPFTDYRLIVTFTGPGAQTYDAPGYYAADGDAANTSADGASDSFSVTATDKAGVDFRGKGMLRYVGEHQFQFAETGEYFLKGGADSPENFLGYWEFDGTYDTGGLSTPGLIDGLHRYPNHVSDWNTGDPTWQSGEGKGIIGAVNYLSGQDINSIYFLTYNIDGGDGRDTWMWTSDTERWRFDASKLDQWEILFDHMDAMGVQLHVVTQEAENDHNLGGSGSLNNIRKLYYRELVARFGHHLAVQWNLGEENDNSDAERISFAQYIRDWDPYDHPIVVHCGYGTAGYFYDGLLGNVNFEGTSIQGDASSYNDKAIQLRDKSVTAGRKWAIYGDEQGPPVASDMSNVDQLRKDALWGNLTGGGAGVEWYFGYQDTFGDVQSEDFAVAQPLWEDTAIALDFFQTYVPFEAMAPDNALTAAADYVLADPGQTYVVYLPNGGTTNITLPAGTFDIKWYDPRVGGSLQDGTVTSVSGGGSVGIGDAPSQTTSDWAVLITYAGAALPTVSIDATDAAADEQGTDPGTFTVTRDDTAGDLDVNYTISGTASAGDYSETLTGTVTILDGQTTAAITVTPIDDAEVEGAESVTLTLSADAAYNLGSPTSDTVTIADNDVPGTIMGPYLQAMAADSVYVLMETDSTDDVIVDYGLTTAYGSQAVTESYVATQAPNNMHNVKLTGLSAGTLYHYRVSVDGGGTWTADNTFTTAVAPGTDFTFAWAGDVQGSGAPDWDTAILAIETYNPAFLIQGGDAVQAGDNYTQWEDDFFNAEFEAFVDGTPFYSAVGNHDGWGWSLTDEFLQFPSPGDPYYSFDYGDVHFLMLTGAVSTSNGSPQWNFAVNDLQNSTARWKIVYNHVGAYVGGGHGEQADFIDMATNIFEPYGVDVMLSGHNHFWQHNMVNGIDYVIASSIGGGYVSDPQPYTVYNEEVNGYAIIDVTYDTLTITGRRLSDGTVIENIVINKGAALPTVSITATDASADEEGPDAGQFTVTRDQTSGDLDVNYTVSGSAGAGDYVETLSGTVTIPDGQSSAVITVTPVDDADVEGPETLTLTLAADAAYTIGAPSSDTVNIADNDLPTGGELVDFETPGDENLFVDLLGGGVSLIRSPGHGGYMLEYYKNFESAVRYSPSGDYMLTEGTISADMEMRYRDTGGTSQGLLLKEWTDAGAQYGGYVAFLYPDNGNLRLFVGAHKTPSGGTQPWQFWRASQGEGHSDYISPAVDTYTPIIDASPHSLGWYNISAEMTYVGGDVQIQVTVTRPDLSTDVYTYTDSDVYAVQDSGRVGLVISGTWSNYARYDNYTITPATVLPTVTLSANDASAAEAGPDAGQFTVARSDTAGDLTVNYSVSGTASAGDYAETLSGS
ncbi:MAG: Calx-beta domain-containing protein, partial [Planctomycetota bacterium]